MSRQQPDLPGMDRLLTKQQLAERLGCTPRTVDRWLQLGVLPSDIRVTIGGTVRFRGTAVDEWISSGCPCSEDAARTAVAEWKSADA